ncbi:NADPH-dependent curcumin reductase [compost metagenome]
MLQGLILRKRIRMQGFIIFDDFAEGFDKFLQQMSEWVDQGKIKFREDLVDGLENAPQAFIGLLQGKNFGKLVIRVADE